MGPSQDAGGPVSGTHVQCLVSQVERKLTNDPRAGLGPFKLYDPRHSFEGHLLDQSVKPLELADVMGHAKVTPTLSFTRTQFLKTEAISFG